MDSGGVACLRRRCRSGEISVDRVGHVSDRELAAIAQSQCPEGKTVYGWAEVLAVDARKGDRSVNADPEADNPYHALILLPEGDRSDDDARTHHANELAGYARWRVAP